jgi:endonuclease/exonuclease/phosphatase family metal-dependent hydrolase
MPDYSDLRPPEDYKKKDYTQVFPKMTPEEKKRTIQNLLFLRAGLRTEIATKKADQNLLVASWNIKEFGHTTQRLYETYFYIAEIISCFDLVAIQEVKSTLKDLNILMQLLGDDWGSLVNDITEGEAGNSERSAYLFNKRRVELAGLAGEIVLWEDLTRGSSIQQLKRTPYMTGFTAGWKTFAMINLHLHPNNDPEDILYRRIEVDLLLKALKEKISRGRLWNENLILVGDFNLYDGADKDDPTINLINQAGFKEVENLIGKKTNTSRTQAYDRFFLTSNRYFSLAKNELGKENGNVFNPFVYVFKDGQENIYKDAMKAQYTGSKNLDIPENLTSYFKQSWRKNQLSDHFPIWFELITDSSDEFLQEKLGGFA